MATCRSRPLGEGIRRWITERDAGGRATGTAERPRAPIGAGRPRAMPPSASWHPITLLRSVDERTVNRAAEERQCLIGNSESRSLLLGDRLMPDQIRLKIHNRQADRYVS